MVDTNAVSGTSHALAWYFFFNSPQGAQRAVAQSSPLGSVSPRRLLLDPTASYRQPRSMVDHG